MRVQVWHAKPVPNFFGDLVVASRFPRGFEHVATVDVMTLDDAFRETQHIDTDWAIGPTVVELRTAMVRSTSVGDVLVDNAGLTFMVAMMGFTKLEATNGQ